MSLEFFVEILDDIDNPTKDFGYITGTTFHNIVMPLIRYKLSDIARLSDDSCSCGCIFPLIESIQGKFEDVLYGGNGNHVNPSVLTFAFKGLSNIKRSQVDPTVMVPIKKVDDIPRTPAGKYCLIVNEWHTHEARKA